ncbi:ABC transporter ATP-binding protein [Anaeroarcus burkinensis]|uniref:ABC transporter ATP-binding protein n=1 Tax=Anaeroarcus burkinensis TaxID=82376 RepID=UPI0004256091|nr:ABC transporter ATP-binding protein [Anaeroarcus burkinensis]
MNSYMRLLKYLRPYLPRLGMAIFCIVLASAANLYVPWIIKDVIDRVLAEKDMMMLNLIAGGIVVVFLLRGIFFYGQSYLMAYVGQRIVIDIREDIYRHLQRLSLSFYSRNSTGNIMSHVTNDVAAVQGALADTLIELITESVILIGSIGAMFFLHWKLALFTFITVPLVGQTINIFGKKLRASGNVMQVKVADITSVLQEAISSIRVIKSFAREDFEIERFQKENFSNFRAQMKNAQLMATLTPLIEFLAAIGVTLIIWYGGWEVIHGDLTAGALIAFLIYAVNLSNPVKRISKSYGVVQRALAAAQRVFEVIDTQPDVQDAEDAVILQNSQGHLVFEGVDFSYNPGEPALRQVFFEANPGQMIAIVGPSGAGKTTIAALIPRFYDPQQGTIYLDGVDIRTVTQKSLREQMAIVLQETVLFNRSVYENIRYGRLEATQEEVVAAAKAANAHDFITAMPQGYETPIGERGCMLSGGQRQRIAIARAILRDPRLLILDEATSALDVESEQLVQEALDKLMVGRTSVVIAHRLSTIVRADCILVMYQGRIVEMGSHEALLQAGGLYQKLYQVQFRDTGAESGEV